MPLVTPITPTPLPTPPSTSQPDNFDARADEFLGALPTMQTDVNSLATATHTNALYALDMATAAQTSASQAQQSESTAALYASQAVTASNNVATKWISGTSYLEGDMVWSPTNYQTYRRKSAGGGVVDPASDNEVNWARIYAAYEPIIVTGTSVTAVSFAKYVFVNISASSEIILPLNPKLGDTIFIDNNTGRTDLWIRRNGKLFMGLAQDSQFDLQASIAVYFAGDTYGWRVQ